MAFEVREPRAGEWESISSPEPSRNAPRVIAIANGKGGCGKTTTAVNLAACLVAQGSRVLLVDIDPQGHASEAVGVDPRTSNLTLYDLLANGSEAIEPGQAVVGVRQDLDLLPGGAALSVLEQRLRKERLEQRTAPLANVLARFSSQYDYLVIDTPPNIGLLTFMALRAAREVIIPLEMSSFAVGATMHLLETLAILCDRIEHTLDVRVLPTLYDGRSRFARSTLAEVRELAGDRCLDAVIRRNIRLVEAAKEGTPIDCFAPTSNGASDYAALAAEVQVSRIGDSRLRPLREQQAPPVRQVRRVLEPEAPSFVRSFSPVSPIGRQTLPR